MIELRSDTLTKPCPAMLDAMFSARVGDDVFGEDLSVIELESYAAGLFGKEAALFCTSGTLTNQLAIMAQTSPGDEVICDENAHIFRYEGGGMATNAQVSARLLKGDKGRLNANQILPFINPDDVHQAVTRIVAVENTMNKGGGAVYNFQDLVDIQKICKENGLIYHLDGARLFNALVAQNETTLAHGALFDSISICLSKGLGAPVGSLLLGSKELISKARRIRKRMGGGWRQAGYLAEAGLYALKNNIPRLATDHVHAKEIGEMLAHIPYIKNVYPIETNIVIFELDSHVNPQKYLRKLEENGIFAVSFGNQLIRFVTHLDFSKEDLDSLLQILPKIQL